MFGLKGEHTSESAGTVKLPVDGCWWTNSDSRGKVLTCLQGRLYVTQEGDWTDYVLTPGQEFTVTRRGLVVVQALDESTVGVKLPVAV